MCGTGDGRLGRITTAHRQLRLQLQPQLQLLLGWGSMGRVDDEACRRGGVSMDLDVGRWMLLRMVWYSYSVDGGGCWLVGCSLVLLAPLDGLSNTSCRKAIRSPMTEGQDDDLWCWRAQFRAFGISTEGASLRQVLCLRCGAREEGMDRFSCHMVLVSICSLSSSSR